jgi:hypothetical protein
MMMPRRQSIVAILFFGLIMLIYVFAVFSVFRPRSSGSDSGELITCVLTFIGGSAAFAFGYASVVILGGKASLRLVEFTSRLNGSRHVIEVEEEAQENSRGLIKDGSNYIPALVFIISLALALNIHYLHTTTDITFPPFLSSILQYTLNTCDIFLKPTGIGSLRYSIEIIPVIVFIVAVAGVVPSIVFPYFRKFRVTGVNGAPFHKDILFGILGAALGLTVVLSLVDMIYGALTGNEPHYYSYVLPTILGFSLHYSLGSFVGREKAEEMVENILKTRCGKRVFQGNVTVEQIEFF